MAGSVHLRKYGVETTIDFDLFEIDGVDFRVDAAHASGDTKVMKDEGNEANTTNGFVDEGQSYSITLDATEMQAARLKVLVVDQSTKIWLDTSIVIETYGNASAQHAMDFDDAVRGGMTALPSTAAGADGGLPLSMDSSGRVDLGEVLGTAQTAGDLAALSNTIQTSVDGIGTAGGANIPLDAAGDNVGGGISGVTSGTTIIGTQTGGTFASTSVLDDIAHVITHAGNVLDVVYQFLAGGGTNAVAMRWEGWATNNDVITISAWDHVGGSFEDIGLFTGNGGSATNLTINRVLFARHIGTSVAELGKVYIRFDSTSTGTVLSTDQLIIEYAVTSRSAGYSNGAIWVDTNNGTAGTESFVNGTADLPTDSWANALTIAGNVGISDFHIINGSTITLTAAGADNYSLFGDNWTLVLAARSIAGMHAHGAAVSGTSTGVGSSFFGCTIASVTIAGPFHFERCILTGIMTLDATESDMEHCTMSGSGPTLEYGNAVGNSIIHMHGYNGAITISSMGDTGTDVLHIDGQGSITTDTCAGGTVHIRGAWKITDSGGNTTFNLDDITIDVDAILLDTAEIGTAGAGLGDLGGMSTAMKAEVNAEADTALADYDGPTNAEMEARTLVAASYFDPAADAVANVTLVDTTTTNTDMVGTDGALTDKAGFSLSTAGILAIWHQLTSAIVNASTIGKLLVTNINATITSRHASGAAVASVAGNVDGNVTGSVGSLATQAKTDVNAEADTALADYDGPTNAEMVARTLVAAAYFDPAADGVIVTTNNDKSGYSLTADFAIKKNTALANFGFLMVLASDGLTPATGLSVTATRSIDGGSFGAAANSVTEIASGYYKINLAAADLNGDTIILRFTAATALDRGITIVTQTE